MRRSKNIFKLFSSLTIAFSLYGSLAIAAPAQKNSLTPKGVMVRPRVEEIEFDGEVVDAWCYTSKVMGDGHGSAHKSCGMLCVGNGVVPGIVDDATGQLYIAAKSKAYQGCNKMLLPYVSQHIHVKGWVAENTGIKLLKLDSVEPIKKEKAKKK